MNILFVTNKNIYPLIGGIERVTYALAKALQSIYGMNCFSLYTQENKYGQTTDIFKRKECINKTNPVEQIVSYIRSEEINVVVAQGGDAPVNHIMPVLREAVNQCTNVKLFFVYHQMPGSELVHSDVPTLLYHLVRRDKKKALRQLAIQSLHTILPQLATRLIEPKYKIPYKMADKVVVLSPEYITQYNRFAKGDSGRYVAIPNILSFDNIKIVPKQKEIVVVSRMSEQHKRIKTVLKIWRRAYQADWQLRIVGYGEDLEYYTHLTKRWHLQNIHFEGLQDPVPYYQKASIFIMTSACEGWALTLTEAQQYGCVPLAFDSYSAVHDIIQTNRNGYIIPEYDLNEYATQLRLLMNNERLRNDMAQHCMEDVQRFSAENITKQWKKLFTTI